MSEIPKSEPEKLTREQLYSGLKGLDALCAELKARVIAHGENENRIGEINNILAAVRQAIWDLEEDKPDAFTFALDIHGKAKHRLLRLEADPEYLGKHADVKD